MKNILQAYTSKRGMLSSIGNLTCFAWAASLQSFPFSLFYKYKFTRRAPKTLETEEEVKNLPDNSTNIFKRNILDWYIDRPNHSFCEGRCSMLDSFCFAEFVSCDTSCAFGWFYTVASSQGEVSIYLCWWTWQNKKTFNLKLMGYVSVSWIDRSYETKR